MAKFFVIALIVAYIALAAASDDAVNDPNDQGSAKSRRYTGVGGVSRTVSGVQTTHQLTSYQQSGIGGGYFGGLAVPAYSTLGINSLGLNNRLGYSNLGYSNLGYSNLGYGNLGYNTLGYNNIAYAAYPGVGQIAYTGLPVGVVRQVPVGYALH